MNIQRKNKNYGNKMNKIYLSGLVLMVLLTMTTSTEGSKSMNNSVVGHDMTLYFLSNSDPAAQGIWIVNTTITNANGTV